MNKIYKIVWSHVMQTWVVVSELCRSKGKTKSKRVLSTAVLAAVSGVALVGSAEGAEVAAKSLPLGTINNANDPGMAIGSGSFANNLGAVAYGHRAQANTGYSVSIGVDAVSGGKTDNVSPDIGLVAIGSRSNAQGQGSTALGSATQATGAQSTAVGNTAKALGSNSAAFGESSIARKDYGLALGKSAEVTDLAGTSVGYNAQAGLLGNAMGAKAKATGESSVAIGSSNLHNGVDFTIDKGAKATATAATAVGASTEATSTNASAFGNEAKAKGNSATAVGDHADATHGNSTALGAMAKAHNGNATAVGTSSEASGSWSTAVGTEANATGMNSAAFGANAAASGTNALAAGKRAKATSDNDVALGVDAETSGTWATAVGSEAKAKGLVSSAFGNGAQATAEGAAAVGSHAHATAKDSLALGRNSTASVAGSVALGQGSSIVGEDGKERTGLDASRYTIRKSDDPTSQDYNKFADKKNTGFGDNEDSDPNKVYAPVKLVDAPGALDVIKKTIRGSVGPVSVGSKNTTRQLINVAPGSADSDAVNVAQLKAVAGSIKHYDVVSPKGDITVTHPDPDNPNKTVWNLDLNPERVKEITKWFIREGNETEDKTENTNQLVRGDDSVVFKDTKTINVTRAVTETEKEEIIGYKNEKGEIIAKQDATHTIPVKAKSRVHTLEFNNRYVSVNSTGGTNEDSLGAKGADAIAIGKGAIALTSNDKYDLHNKQVKSDATSAVVIGHDASSKQARTVALGYNATTLHTSAIAIGDKAYSDGARGIAIGRFAQSTGDESIALGSSNQQNDDKNNRTIAKTKGAVAIGSGAVAEKDNGIALGAQSKTTVGAGEVGFNAADKVEDVARQNDYKALTKNTDHIRTSTLAGLSIGDTNKTRQINHLAAGTQDSDAVNVAQLKSVNLAFKGDNNTTGDVRLFDQRLSIVGESNKFIVTSAGSNKLTIGTVVGTFNVNNNGKFETTGNGYTNGLATVEAVSNAVNNSGWKLSHNSTPNGIVKPGDEVNFANGKGTTVDITGDKDKRVVKINTNINAGNNITINEDSDGKLTINATPIASDYSFNVRSKITKLELDKKFVDGKQTYVDVSKTEEQDVSTVGNTHSLTFANGGMMRLDVTKSDDGKNTTVTYTPVIQDLTANDDGSVKPTEGTNQGGFSKTGMTSAQGVANAINQSGWNIGGNGKTKVDLINPGEQVNFINGNATISTVTKDGDNVNVKYDITTGDGLKVDGNAVKVQTDGKTIITKDGNITANTGDVESDSGSNKGKVKVHKTDKVDDAGKLATVDTVVKAVNSAKWFAKAKNDDTAVITDQNKTTDADDAEGQGVGAGDKLVFTAGKNLRVKRDNGVFTFATTDTPEFKSTTYKNGDKSVTVSVNDSGDLNIAHPNAEAGKGDVKITGVAEGKGDNDAVNVKQLKDSISTETVRAADATNGDTNIAEVSPAAESGKGKKGATYEVAVKASAVKNIAKTAVKVAAGDNVIVTPTDDKTNNETIYTVEAVTPVVYTKKDGTRVYRVKQSDGTYKFNTQADGKGTDVANGDVIASIFDASGNTKGASMIVNNVGSAIQGRKEDGYFKQLEAAAKKDATPNAAVNVSDLHTAVDTLRSNEIHIAPTKDKEGNTAATHYKYDTSTKQVVMSYVNGKGEAVENTKAVIDFTDLASSINNYSFKTNATGDNATGGTNGKPSETTIASGKAVNFAADKNLTLNQNVKDGNVTYTYGLSDVVTIGKLAKDGKNGNDGADGAGVVINGKDGSIGLTGKNGANGLTVKGDKGVSGVDGKDGETVSTTMTRIVYETPTDNPEKPTKHTVATLDDGMKFGGDVGNVANVKLNKQVDVKGGVTDKTKLSEGNIGVVSTPNETTGGTELSVRLAKELKGLTSAEFKTGDDAPNTVITNNGITITPVKPAMGDAKPAVSLTKNGLDNGGNYVTNVASNLKETQNNTNPTNVENPQSNATKSQTAPDLGTGTNQVNKNNAATVGDVLNAGWNLQGNGEAVDFVKPYDTVNFVGGTGTTASVESKDGKTTTVAYNVNAGAGLEVISKDDAHPENVNKLVVKTDDKTINIADGKVTAVTGETEAITKDNKGADGVVGKIRAKKDDAGKLITVEKVAEAVNSAKWFAKAKNDDTAVITDQNKTTDADDAEGQGVGAGDKLVFTAGKNLRVKRDAGVFTFALNKELKDLTSTTYKNGDKSVTVSVNDSGDLNITNPNAETEKGDVKITGVAEGKSDNDAVNVKQLNDSISTETVRAADATNGDTNIAEVSPAAESGKGKKGATYEVAVKASAVKNIAKTAVKVAAGDNVIVTSKDNENATETTYTVEAVTPVVYTDKKGNRVYKVKDGKGYKFTKNADGTGDVVDKADVIASIFDASGNTKGASMIVNNVGSAITNEANKNTAFIDRLSTAKDNTPNAAVNVSDLHTAVDTLRSNEIHIAPTKDKDGDTAATHYKYDTSTKQVVMSYVNGKGEAVENTKAVIDFTDLASSINNYSFKANATGNVANEADKAAKATDVASGKTVNFDAGKNLTVKQSIDSNNNHTYSFALKDDVSVGEKGVPGENGKDGIDGKVSVNGKDGSAVVIHGKDGSIGLNGKNGANGLTVKGDKGVSGVDGTDGNNGKDGMTRIVYETPTKDPNSPTKHTVATLDDGMKFGGDVGNVANVKLNKQVDVKGGVTDKTKLSDKDNIGVESVPDTTNGGTTLKVRLAKDVDLTSGGSLTTGKTKVDDNGVTITPTTTEGKPDPDTNKVVKLTKDGLNNGGNHITNVKGNLPETRNVAAGETKPITKHQDAPENVNNNNAATVGDVLNAGWNLQGNSKEVDFVKPYDTVNFVGGTGTTASVESKDGKTTTVAYNVNAGAGLEVTDKTNTNPETGNKLTVKAGKGIEVDGDGVHVKTDDKTITKNTDGNVTAVTGDVDEVTETSETDNVKKGQVSIHKDKTDSTKTDAGKLATVDTVVKAVNSAKWFAKADNSDDDVADTEKTQDTDATEQGMGAGDKLTLRAGKNLRVNRKANTGEFTFALDKELKDLTSTTYKNNNGKTVTINADTNGDLHISKPGTAPNTTANAKITGIADGTKDDDAVNVKQLRDSISTETVRAADVTDDTNIAEVSPAAESGKGKKGATYEVAVKASAVKKIAKTAVKVAAGDNVIVTPTDDKTNNETTYTVEAVTPVVYTKKDGTRVYRVKQSDGTYKFYTQAGGKGEEVANNEVIASIFDASGSTTGASMIVNNVGSAIQGRTEDGYFEKLKAAATSKTDATPNAAVNVSDLHTAVDTLRSNEIHIAPTKDKEGNTAATHYKYDTSTKQVVMSYVNGKGEEVKNTKAVIDFTDLASSINNYSFKANATGNVANEADKAAKATDVASGKTVNFDAGKNLTVKQSIDTDNNHTYSFALKDDVSVGEKGVTGENGKDGIDGKVSVNGKDGSAVVIHGKDGSIGLNGKNGANGLTVKGDKGVSGVDGKDGETVSTTMTRIVYETPTKDPNSPTKHTVATLDDGMKYAGDDAQGEDKAKVIAKKLNETIDIIGGAEKEKLSNNNIGVNNDGNGKLKVQLSKELKGLTSAEFKTVDGDKTKTTTINSDGITIKPSVGDKTKSVSLTNNGLDNGGNAITNVNSGLNKYGDNDGAKKDLINLNNTNVDDHTAATVGDLRKMGWIVSSDKSTDDPNAAYSAQVKNAEEVKFVGINGAKVSGKTDDKGVRTITVDVDAQKAVEEAQLPVVYTDADGNKLVKVDGDFYHEDDIDVNTGKPVAGAKAVKTKDVIGSMNNGDNDTNGTMTLANVASHLPSVSDTDKDATDVDGITKLSTNNTVAPITAAKAAEILEKAGDHAATVSDVLNAGWGLKANGSAVDFVRPFDSVNVVNGTNTTVVAESDGVDSKMKVNLNPDLKDLTSAEFKTKDDKGNATSTTTINGGGITIQPSEGDNTKSVSLTNKGLDNAGNQIHNVKEGTDGKDAVNVDQLKQVEKKFTDGKLTFAGNTGTAHDAKLNTTVNIKGGKDNTDYAKFDEGKNIITKVDGDTLTIAMKKTPDVEGINIVDNGGKVKVKITQTDEGLKIADDKGNATRITNVKAGEKDTDAVNVKQLKDFASNIKNVEVNAGKNITDVHKTTKDGKTSYTIDAEDTTATVVAETDGLVKVKVSTAHYVGDKKVTDYTVDLTDKAKKDIGKGVDAHTTVTTKGLTFNADKGTTGVKKLGDSVGVKGDGKNIVTTADASGVTVKLKDDINVNSVTVNNVKIDKDGINAGGNRITNVADGKDPHDAVNVSQLKGVANNIHNHIGNVDRNLRAGIAGALASSQLPQAYTPGKSMVSLAAGNFRGQNGLALGMSRISDNGKIIIRLAGTANSQGQTGIAAGVGYQW